MPLVFMLLTCKSAAIYEKAFTALEELNPDLSPRRVITDFGLAALNSFRKDFPTKEVKGCFFHFAQTIWRKIQDLGLAGLHKENDEMRKVVKSLVALALIPSEDVHLAFCKIFETLPPDTPLMPFLEYYENTWLEHLEGWDGEPSHFSIYRYGTSMKKL